MSQNQAYEAAKASIFAIPGVTGVSKQGNTVIVYVVDDSVQVPSSVAGFSVQKKVSGKISLLK